MIMTDESNQSPQKAPKRQLKIGSQRDNKSTRGPLSSPTSTSSAEDSTPEADASSAPLSATSPTQSTSDAQTFSSDSLPPADQPSVDKLFPASPVQQMTGDIEAEVEAALGDFSIEDMIEQEDRVTANTGASAELDQPYPARVIKSDRESVFVTFGGQYEGVAARRQFNDDLPAPGTELKVVPVRYLVDDGLYEVLVPGASVDVQDWSDLTEGVVVEARITGHNKGGLECEVNQIRGFIPVSHVALYRVEDMEGFVGESLQCVVTEANPSRRNLVLSRRAVLEREREAARDKLLAELEPGQVREGTVTRLQDFGAFVDLGGIDGLIHVSQLSWDRIQHPKEVVEEGQRVKVRVDKVDPESGRIGLSYRDLLEDPWETAEAKFGVGAVVEGTVSKLMDFGAFVRLASGIEGLVHISEIAHHRVSKVSAFLKEGQSVDVKVLSFDRGTQRISLSIKAAQAVSEPEQVNTAEPEEAEASQPAVPESTEPLKGGLNRDSGGGQFGLKW